ncbi:AAA domain-containing protein [Streptacidiphilus sp. PAMC 29251]
MGWREEIATALDAWIADEGGSGRAHWQRVGAAVRGAEPGEFSVDTRGAEISADLLDKLRLDGPGEPDDESGFPVMEATSEGAVLRVKVAEFAELPEPYLWLYREVPTFLITALKDGLAALTDAGLADRLARGELGGSPGPLLVPTGLLAAQEEAYRACLGTGVWLVWGPPGTGKTRLLRRAIGDLIGAGKRVLLVSGTNIAVDNALLGVVREKSHGPGQIVRVGPPQLREIADDPGVCLPLMVRSRLSEVEEQRLALSANLLRARRRAEELQKLEACLVGFDVASHRAALAFTDRPEHDESALSASLARARARVAAVSEEIGTAEWSLVAARAAAEEAELSRDLWQSADVKGKECQEVEQAAVQAEGDALVDRAEVRRLEVGIEALRNDSGKIRRRDRASVRDLQDRLATADQRMRESSRTAGTARATADRFTAQMREHLRVFEAAIPHSRMEIQRRQETAQLAQLHVTELRRQERICTEELATARQLSDLAVDFRALIEQSRLRDWPALHVRAEEVRPRVAMDRAQQVSLEKQYAELQGVYDKLARDAQGEIIRSARLVATTLARLRTTKAVLEGPYDVVLVDEAGAATLPEVLLAAAKAKDAVVLLGDFMQLGAVLPKALKEKRRPDIQRWILPDVFAHCGIVSPEAADRRAGCIVLDTQHRFGPVVMDLANAIAYDGTLKAGPNVRAHSPDDPEIVLVDTDDMNELTEVRLISAASGWWPAGVLLARVLADYHNEVDATEAVGVVTPYRTQARATLEALRDVEGTGRALAEVGTAHRFQGREFPVVIFDTVESLHGTAMWMAKASRLPDAGDWARDGARLFNVAVTRTQARLYVIASKERIGHARPGTALAHLAQLMREGGVRTVPGRSLVTPNDPGVPPLGEIGKQLADVLARHVEVSAIDDERSFYDTFADHLDTARESVWLWAPWVASRVHSLLPVLKRAVDRGVRVTVFVRDPTDNLQRKNPQYVTQLREIVPTVVPVNVMHQKIVVIDERITLIGSLNPLSQKWTRETMVTLRGRHFARWLLSEQHAEDFAQPPTCDRCGLDQVDLRRGKGDNWWWHCYNTECPARNGTRAWKKDIRLTRARH